jgi:hypothetical protein
MKKNLDWGRLTYDPVTPNIDYTDNKIETEDHIDVVKL